VPNDLCVCFVLFCFVLFCFVSLPINVFRLCLLPLIVTRGSDQLPVTTSFNSREDISIARNYGSLVVDLSASVPDGICVFFPSYL
jgi:DNA excision repair protein ERCC-2